MVSSKINQWTLLVGTLPLVFVASGSLHGLPVETAQREEVLLTAAQTVFAVALLVNLSISLREAFALFGLFWAQFILGAIVPPSAKGTELLVLSGSTSLLGAWLLVRKRGDFRHLLRDGFRTPTRSWSRRRPPRGRRVSGHEVEGQGQHGVRPAAGGLRTRSTRPPG